jgi:hypothetical protein
MKRVGLVLGGLAVAVGVLLALIFGGPSNGGRFAGGVRDMPNVGSGGVPPYERNCPHPSPGQWCPYVDDGQVQPQPVWP